MMLSTRNQLLLIALGMSCALSVPTPAFSSEVVCESVLLEDTVLEADLECPGTALVAGADNITIDLNGHTARSTESSGYGVDITGGFQNVTVKNGVLEGFGEGIRAQGANGLRIENVFVRGASSASTAGAIHVLLGKDLEIKDCRISVDGDRHGVRLDSVEGAKVERVLVEGGNVGVYLGSFASLDPPTIGSVKGCVTWGNAIGILAANTTDALIEANEVWDARTCGIGIGIGGIKVDHVRIRDNVLVGNADGIAVQGGDDPSMLPMANHEIVGNEIQGGDIGMVLNNLTDSLVSGNRVTGCLRPGIFLARGSSGNLISGNRCLENGMRGIVLLYGAHDNLVTGNMCLGNGSDGISLFVGANTGNIIVSNVCLENGKAQGGFDLFHNEESTPNTWKDNIYETCSGADLGPTVASFRRGDVSGDAALDLSDAISILGFLFLGKEAPACLDSADCNDNGKVDLTDAVYLLSHLFMGGPEPPAPFPDPGADPTPDGLSCGGPST